ncbi:hypothetical protein TNCV_260511 [Trichonephila clavipes]|nr:hypothetical protein TNCV_260511 [Trichonephila clavipes]
MRSESSVVEGKSASSVLILSEHLSHIRLNLRHVHSHLGEVKCISIPRCALYGNFCERTDTSMAFSESSKMKVGWLFDGWK